MDYYSVEEKANGTQMAVRILIAGLSVKHAMEVDRGRAAVQGLIALHPDARYLQFALDLFGPPDPPIPQWRRILNAILDVWLKPAE